MAVPFEPPLTTAEVISAFATSYRDAEPIFVGGQAAVFRVAAQDAGTHALKIYFPDPDAHVDERTDREVAALRLLRGETLVSLEADGHVLLRGTRCRYVATSFIAGESLRNRLKRGALPVALAARIGVDVAEALTLLWSQRIVHRDITPNNVMLAATQRAVLIDLGLARHTALSSISRPNEGWGTMGYLSPEQFGGTRALTCKSDIFALGIVLQECLSGAHPTDRRQTALSSGGPRTAALNAGLPQGLCDIVDAMVHRSPPLRPTPAAVIRELVLFAEG